MSDRGTGVPHFPLPMETLVREVGGQPLLRLEGLLPLPVGARINLDDLPDRPGVPLDRQRFPRGRADAVVVNVLLWGTQSEDRCLVLEVELHEPGWRSLTGVALQSAAAEAQAEEDVVEAAERITGVD
jgi:hypothetical protein